MYRCVTLVLDPPQPAAEIFIAALAELGFDSFEETDTGLRAYVREADWDPEAFAALPYLDSPDWQVSHTVEAVETQNWNAVWEAAYQPIRVGEQCVVRAPFHPKPDPPVPYDLVIAPKMSFGTGHHQTTWLMLGFLLDLEVAGLSVLDMGSGTGVLAILAACKGAGPVTAIDIDPWCYENCRENAERNGHPEIEVLEGDASAIKGPFDLILANINKNVLLADLPAYVQALNPGGTLLISGFYRSDLEDLKAAARAQGLQPAGEREKDQWMAARFLKRG